MAQQSSLFTETSQTISGGFPQKLAIVDCETTGGKSTYHRIIEIGIILIDEGQETQRWQSLVNPEVQLPSTITRLTGIQPEHLNGAPTFSELAVELLELLSQRVLVAHNARFDYGFLKNEFKRVGHSYSSQLLCSVKFSRALFPQFKRHSLDAIIRRFQWAIQNRHRALDDAEIVQKLFLKSSSLFSKDDIHAVCEHILKTPTLPIKLDPAEIKRLPTRAGVYYFYDDHDNLLYVGKSVNIRNRVLNHFSQDYRNHKDLKMSQRIAHIDFAITPSDFGAQLLESQQIKTLNPLMNHRLRKVKRLYQLRLSKNSDGYLTPKITPVETASINQQNSEQVGLFRSRRQANKQLEILADQFLLCHQLLGLEPLSSSSCFRFQLRRCLGACSGEETAEIYNERVNAALAAYQVKAWPWPSAILVKENAPENEACQYHVINNWVYCGQVQSEDELQQLGYCVQKNHQAHELHSAEESHLPQQHIEGFDLDMYFILIRFLFDAERRQLNQLEIMHLSKIHDDSV